MGANAWADATVIYGRATTADADNGYSAWSADDVAASGTDLNVWIGQFVYNENYGLYQSANGGRSAVMTFSHTDNSIQTFDIVFNNLGNTGNASNYSYIKIGSDIEIQSNQQNQNGTVIINGNSSSITDCNVKNYNRGGDSWTIHVEINSAKNTVQALTIIGTEKSYGNNTKHAHYTLSSETALSSSATYNTVTIGFTRSGGTPSAALTSIRIAEEEQTVTNADYTINYIYDETTVKSVEGTSTVDATINAELPFTVDGQKYFAADGATTSITLIDGENILNVNLRKANEYVYSVQNNFGTSIASGTYIEGESAINVYWSKYVEDNGVWYECDETSYGVSITGTLDKTVNYTTPSNFSYFIECENMNVSRSPAASDTGTGYSGGKTVRHYSSSYWWTPALPGGVYSLTIPYKNNNSSDGTIYIYLRDSEGNLTETGLSIVGAKQSSGTISAEGISIPAGSSLVLNNTTAYNSNVLMDYVALTKTADYTVTAAVTSIGCATFCSPYALDFSNATSIKAYTAKVGDDGKITFTNVKTVAAGEGVLLKSKDGKEAEEEIPVIASAEANANNDFVGIPETVQLAQTAYGATNYILSIVDNKLGFYMVNTNGSWCKGGTAYLKVSSAKARAFYSLDNDTTTAISDELVETESDAAVFNLNGQRVTAPQKGLYIVNGKKVVVK